MAGKMLLCAPLLFFLRVELFTLKSCQMTLGFFNHMRQKGEMLDAPFIHLFVYL